MELIDVQPKDFMFLFGMPLADLKSLKIVLDNMEFKYNGQDPEHVKAKVYLEKLYQTISEAFKAVEDYENDKSSI